MTKMDWQDMATNDLVSHYVSAAIRHWEAGKLFDEEGKPDVKTSNRIMDEIIGIHRALSSRHDVAALMPLIEHEHIGVRMCAAEHCLPLAPDRILPLFEEWRDSDSEQVRLAATSALWEWRLSQKRKGQPQQNDEKSK